MKLYFSEAARRELDDAFAYLEQEQAGLGYRFTADVDEALSLEYHFNPWLGVHSVAISDVAISNLVRLAALYHAFGWLATRFRALTPPMQSSWTVSRTPLKLAKRTLHEQMAARKTR